MVSGKLFRQILDKFIASPVGGEARVQVVLPNGEFYDITGAKLMQNKLIGVRESHRIVLTVTPERARMGKVLKKIITILLTVNLWPKMSPNFGKKLRKTSSKFPLLDLKVGPLQVCQICYVTMKKESFLQLN
jgi:hypothetical protein